ncbi:MAG: serine/threonine protein kinase [Coriobacteriia bacterium]|nr:serine/threonine protein kinase [Coriobacteriia bacterium]
MEEQLILDRYRPLADLGSGGFGSVVLAFDTKMARRVAIKRLKLPTDRHGRPLDRTGLAEARTAAMLNHPAIVTVHEWDTDGADAYIVMEDIDGASLADIIDERGEPLDDDEAAWVLESVGAAVSFAHDNGVLHLDLKPANVLVARDGRVKVADFGISALTDASGRAVGATGTIGFMPPEQIRAEHVDERTDVWALGALFYELLTRANPFDAETTEGSLFKIEVAPVPAPSEFDATLSADIDEVLLTATAPEPGDRYASVGEFVADLGPQLGDAAAGRRRLASYLDDTLGDEEDFDGEHGRLGVWDALAPYAPWFRRAGGALVCGWLGWAGTAAVLGDATPSLVAAALVGLAGALAPGLGLALGGIAISAGVGVATVWWAGVATLAVIAGSWVARGRHGQGDALLPAAAPVLAVIRCAPLAPLLAGFVFTPLPAAVAGCVSALLTLIVAAAGGSAAPLLQADWQWLLVPWEFGVPTSAISGVLADPGALIVVASWAGAAAACSVACRRLTRTWAVVGMLAGVGLMAGGYALWGLVARNTALLTTAAPDLLAALALMAGVIALGPPARPVDE